MDSLIKCIYCLEPKPLSSFAKTEHVIPQSFGVFKNNLTLNKIVCDECNQYLGDNLELYLARDTFEGISRFKFEVKKPSEFKTVGGKSRLIIKVEEGEAKGTYAFREFSKEQGGVVLKPLPQIGFKKVNSPEYEYYLLDEIPEKSSIEQKGLDLSQPKSMRIFCCELGLAKKKLSAKGYDFKYGGVNDLSGDTNEGLLCEVEGTIDKTIFRAIAKIGFNYLAYWEGADFVMNNSFNPMRKFILKGEKPTYPLVRIYDKSILADERTEGKRRVGHLITVNWAGDKVSIVSQVSIFNWSTYSISLAKDYSGKYRNIRRGHFFNTNNQEILDLEVRNSD